MVIFVRLQLNLKLHGRELDSLFVLQVNEHHLEYHQFVWMLIEFYYQL